MSYAQNSLDKEELCNEKEKFIFVRYDLHIAVTIFWDVTPCSPAEISYVS
jgi:hypothetical protein